MVPSCNPGRGILLRTNPYLRPMSFALVKYAVVFLLLIGHFAGSAQNSPLIPYRKGYLWGLADTTAKVVVTPQFDRCMFIEDSPFSAQGNRKGFVIQSGKLFGYYSEGMVVPPKYADLRFANAYFIAAYSAVGNVDYYLNSGKPAVPKGWMITKLLANEFIESPKGERHVLFLECVTPNKLRSLYALPIEAPELAQELIKGCSKIELADQRNNQLHFEVERDQTDYEELLTFEYQSQTQRWVACNPKRPITKSTSDIYETEGVELREFDGYDVVAPPAVEEVSGYSSGVGSGSGPGDYRGRNSKIPSTIRRSYANYSIAHDSVFLSIHQRGQSKTHRIHIPLPPEATNPKVLAYNTGASNQWNFNDSVVVYANFLRYQLKHQQVVQCFHHQNPLVFDSLERFPVAGSSREMYFLAGQRNAQGVWQMGVITDSGAVVLPLELEHIETGIWLGPDDANHPNFRLAVRKDGKAGFIALKPGAQLEGMYDQITVVRPSGYSSKPFFSLKKGELYGIAFRPPDNSYRHMPVRVEPQFPYTISSYFTPSGPFKYPYYLFKCINDKGEFMGYADRLGRTYFVD